MKIAACAICKDEKENISKWLDHTKDFDYRIVVDTGSTDSSMELLSKSDVILTQKKFEPFRFDEARNFVLTLVPDDVDWCIWPDFDEHYSDNTIDEIKKVIEENPKVTRFTYKTFLIKNGIKIKGFESGTIMESKIHANKLYKWVKPIHEHLSYVGNGNEVIISNENIIRKHYHNSMPERDQLYYNIVKLAVKENPNDEWNIWFALKDAYELEIVEDILEYGNKYIKLTKPKTNFRSLAFIYIGLALQRKKQIIDDEVISFFLKANLEDSSNTQAKWLYINSIKQADNKMKLNLGCGNNKVKGFINVDKYDIFGSDIVHDLEVFPWPFKDNSVDYIMIHHVLEHLGQTTQQFLNILAELYRISKPNAVIDIVVPHPYHNNFIGDPTHVRAITPEQFSLFDKDTYTKNSLRESTGLQFQVLDLMYNPDYDYQVKLDAGEITYEEVLKLGKYQLNVFDKIKIMIKVIKDEA